ncbi:MAG: hypothetical protein J6B68_04035 [Lachnospiraceae bacterium]|nr:hypothetical protein [Lachnospiraceae bacterium]
MEKEGENIVTKELLESYRSKKAEIAELQYKLNHLNDGDAMIGNDTIFDYRSGYPMPQAVVGVDWGKVNRTTERYEDKIEELTKECEEIEEFIEAIPDSITRRIFRLHYIDGISQKNVAKMVHLERSGVCKKISNFLQLSTNSTNSIL